MNFNCNICNYEARDKSNYNKHIRSKKHQKKSISVVENIPQIYPEYSPNIAQMLSVKVPGFFPHKKLCEFCRKSFAHPSSYYRHRKKKCTNIYTDVDILKNQLAEYQQIIKDNEIKYLKREISIVKQYNNDLTKLIQTGKVGNTYNISVKNYVQQNYPDAPPLEKLDNYERVKYDQEYDDFVDTLVYNYNHSSLHKYLGDFIVKYYKKDDPSRQSMWSSDTSRLTYIIKEIISNNKSIWNHDYKGVKTKSYIVTPLLKYIKDYIDEYWITNIDLFKTDDLSKLNKFNKIYQTIHNIKRDIENDILADDIVRYIAPHFYMSTRDSDIKLLEQNN
jgi:hypothetical protein